MKKQSIIVRHVAGWVVILGTLLGVSQAQAQKTTVSFSLVGLDGKPLSTTSDSFSLASASYQVALGKVNIKIAANGDTTPLSPQSYSLGGQLINPSQVAYGLLLNLRQAAISNKLTRKKLEDADNKYGAQLLFPHRRFWRLPWHWQWPWNAFSPTKTNGTLQEQQIRDAFLSQLENQLRAEWHKTKTGAISPPKQVQAGHLPQGSIAYATEQLIAATPRPRMLKLTILDRGTNPIMQGERRYLVCAGYETHGGDYVGPTVQGSCTAQPGRVTVSVEMESLNNLEIFVSNLSQALDSANLRRTDGLYAFAFQESEEATIDLAQKKARAAQLHIEQKQQEAAYLKCYNEHLGAAIITTTDSSARRATRNYNSAQAEVTTAERRNIDARKNTRHAVTKAEHDNEIVGDANKAFSLTLAKIYNDYTTQKTRSTAAPMAGVIEIQSSVMVQDNIKNSINSSPFLPDSIQMVIEDGNIEELKAVGQLNGQSVQFETYAPIGISSDRNLSRSWPRQLLWSQTSPSGFGGKNVCIKLTDLLRYTANMQANGKDRSPADGVYTLHPTDGLARRSLPKLTTTKLLQARVYTDLGGINGVSKPNGLIQIEVSKKLEWGVGWTKFSRFLQFRAPGYFLPLVAVTKIEQQNRFLPLLRVPQAAGAAPLYTVNTIDLLRYTNLRVGGDFNMAGVRWAALKSDFYLDASIYLDRVDIRDSVQRPNSAKLVRIDSTLNVAMYGIGLTTRFRPDSRYGVQSRIGFYRYNLVNNLNQNNKILIEQRPYITGLNPNAHTQLDKYIYQGVLQYELLAWASLSENSRVFFRPQFSHLLYQSNHTYFQFQIGYQFDVFTDSDKREKAVPVKSFW